MSEYCATGTQVKVRARIRLAIYRIAHVREEIAQRHVGRGHMCVPKVATGAGMRED